MKKMHVTAKADMREFWTQHGFAHYDFREPYWVENTAYVFGFPEMDAMEDQLNAVHALGHKHVDSYIERMLSMGAIVEKDAQWMRNSRGQGLLLERLDIAWDGKQAKLIDWNTQMMDGLFEAAVAQWHWSERYTRGADQFNLIQAALLTHIGQWSAQFPRVPNPLESGTMLAPVHTWGSYGDEVGDAAMAFLQRCFQRANVPTLHLDEDDAVFEGAKVYDEDGVPVRTVVSLGPMEGFLGTGWTEQAIQWINPPWALAMEHQGFLAHLHEKEPTHPVIVPASFVAREGWIPKYGWTYQAGGVGANAHAPCMWQEEVPIAPMQLLYPVVQAWFVAGSLVGVSVVDDLQKMHAADSYRFVPHIIA